MIYTVTFNPAIDYIVNIDDFKIGEVNRVKMDTKYPGGKGINVSRVLNNLEVKSTALGFIGNFTGEYIKNHIENEGIKTDFINVDEDTRINIKIKSEKETEINGLGPNIDEKTLEKLFEKADKFTDGDIVVLAGNVQKSVDFDVYAIIQERCSDKDIKFVIDTTGNALICTLINKPFLIKPNKQELSELFEVDIKNKEDIVFYGRKLIGMGAQNVIVSNGGEGAILICKQGSYNASPAKGIIKNSVGAGDSMVAGFIANFTKTNDILEAFKWGAAAGGATAFSLDLCTKNEVTALIDEIIITKIN
ncbi:MAG: 1-phosphofructokinase [Bacillota bacterium]|nr:1-phosphofructokinase [Bacillota bacterium]